MKTTKAITIAALIILFSSFDLSAQILGAKRYTNDTRVDIGLSVGLPTMYAFRSVVDADIRLQKDFSPSIAGLVNAGFTYFLHTDAPVLSEFNGNTVFLPVRTAVKVFLTEKLYVSGGIGASFRTTAVFSTSLLHSQTVGYEFKKGIDLGLGYESITRYNVSKIALKVAYGFRMKKRTKYTSWYH